MFEISYLIVNFTVNDMIMYDVHKLLFAPQLLLRTVGTISLVLPPENNIGNPGLISEVMVLL